MKSIEIPINITGTEESGNALEGIDTRISNVRCFTKLREVFTKDKDFQYIVNLIKNELKGRALNINDIVAIHICGTDIIGIKGPSKLTTYPKIIERIRGYLGTADTPLTLDVEIKNR